MGRVLGRVVPQPYAAVVRVLTGLFMLPRAVRDELAKLVMQGFSRVVPCPAPATSATAATSTSTRTTATAAPNRPTPAASSAPASGTTESTIPGFDWQALAQDVDASEGPDPSTSRYPASNASGRKGSSRRR